MHIAICDDNIADRKQLERLLKRESDKRKAKTGLLFADSFGNCRILSTKDSVHIRADIRLTGQTGTYISRDMKTDIFPFASGLVARPDAGIALCACPSVQ